MHAIAKHAALTAEQERFINDVKEGLMPGEDVSRYWVEVTDLEGRRIARSLIARGLLVPRTTDTRIGLMEVRLAA